MVKLFAFILFITTLPIYPVLYVLIKLSSPGPFIFRQKRMGKNKKIFTMYKFRTMIKNAEKLKEKYIDLNETSGPAFKIKNDPRYTKIGKILARSAIDELPQLIDIIKGEMTFVGPRPLPVNESQKIPKKYDARFSVLPGLTSPWVVEGSHRLSFSKWMRLDVEYTKNKNTWYDIKIIGKTIVLIIKSILTLYD